MFQYPCYIRKDVDRLKHVLDDVHDSFNFVFGCCMSPMCRRISHIESGIKYFPIAGTDESRILQRIQFVVKAPSVAHLFENHHVNQCSRTHHRQP